MTPVWQQLSELNVASVCMQQQGQKTCGAAAAAEQRQATVCCVVRCARPARPACPHTHTLRSSSWCNTRLLLVSLPTTHRPRTPAKQQLTSSALPDQHCLRVASTSPLHCSCELVRGLTGSGPGSSSSNQHAYMLQLRCPFVQPLGVGLRDHIPVASDKQAPLKSAR